MGRIETSRTLAAFDDPSVGLVFGAVAAAAHDPRREFIPTFCLSRRRRLRGARVRPHRIGMGANMAVRRSVIDQVGGFEERIGPGSVLRSGDDWELALRVLTAGYAVVQEPESVVVHWGGRPFAGGTARQLIGNNFYGIGGGDAYHLWWGHWSAGLWLLQEFCARLAEVGARLATGRQPLGLTSLVQFVLGVFAGWSVMCFML